MRSLLIGLGVRHLSHSALPMVLIAMALWMSTARGPLPLDRWLFDTVSVWRQGNAVTDSVVIAIDDQSLNALGHWPWSRARHAELLDILHAADSGPVVIDILFADPDPKDTAGDALLAAAIARHGKVFLPVIVEELNAGGQLVEVLPFAPFLQAAQGLGHVHIACDQDAICRSAYLYEGLGEARWPHIALAIQQVRFAQQALPGRQVADAHREQLLASPYWVHRDFHNYVPFHRDDSVPVVSVIDVLSGKIPAATFAGKTVFIGATAAGMNDVVSTPTGRYSGVIATALIAHHLQQGTLVTRVDSPWVFLAMAALLVSAMFAASFLGPGHFFLATLALIVTVITAQAVALIMAHRWLAFMSFVVVLAIYYPLWSWLRLEIAVRFLQRSLQDKKRQQGLPLAKLLADKTPQQLPWWQGRDVITRTLEQWNNADRLQESTYILLQQTFASLQEGCCIFDHTGRCHLVNKLMSDYFPDWAEPTMASLGKQLQLAEGWHWSRALENLLARGESFSAEATTHHGGERKALFLQAQSCHFVADGKTVALGILTVTDISALKASEQARRETLAFISHDLRSPLVSILSLLKNHSAQREQEQLLVQQVEQYAQRNLNYTESLLQLHRAEQIPKERFNLIDLQAVCDDAFMQVLPFAKEQACELALHQADDDCWVLGDFELLQRVIVNLLTNAVKYGASAQPVALTLQVNADQAIIQVRDYGPGLRAPLAELIQSFNRPAQAEASGAGLGLYFVNTVVKKHGGTLHAISHHHGAEPVTAGCIFTVSLPLTDTSAFVDQ